MELINNKRRQIIIDEIELTKLVDNFKGGDESSFEKLVQIFQQEIFKLCYGFMKQYEDAEEVAQDIFMLVYRKINKFQGKSKFRTWLYRVAINVCIGALKKRGASSGAKIMSLAEITPDKKNSLENVVIDNRINPREMLTKKQIQDCVNKKLKHLSPKLLSPLVLIHFQGLKYEEAAEIIGCKVGTVKSRLNRAFNKLKVLLQECWKLSKEG